MRRVTLLQRVLAWVAVIPTTLLPFCASAAEAQHKKEYLKAREPHFKSELKPGLTQTLTPEQWKKVDAKRAKEAALKEANRPDVRVLTDKELQNKGRGPYRNKYFAGTLPWHRSLKDVNLCNGNLFKSFTDVQVAPAKGAGLALQRTYNSMDDRIGPFGQGWTHAYDIRTEEENPTTNQTDDALNYVDRSDFFAGKHKYHRDADGLYSPPPYLFDETESAYDSFLVSGPVIALEDTERSMDGTAKHFVKNANSPERVCDSITDRYGNATTLTYSQVLIGGVTRNLLQTVTDPSGRQLFFTWTNLGTGGSPAYRITQVQGPLYVVSYAYNTDLNLSGVTLDPGTGTHVNRSMTFGYATVSGTNGTETGLLSSVTDALGHTMSYGYGISTLLNTAFPTSITEPAGVDVNNNARTLTTNIAPPFANNNSYIYSTVTTPTTTTRLWSDPQLRFMRDGYGLVITSYTFSHFNSLDSANNVLSSVNSRCFPNDPAQDAYLTTRTDNSTYGPHGNQLTHSVSGFPGVDTTDYYDGSQYFQKKSVTDMLGRVSTFGVGNKLGADPSNVNLPASNGQKGSVLWVRDAGYSVSTSPSYNKQFTYSYNSNGQKVSETNFNGIVTNNTYGDLWGNLTQVVQDPGTGHLARTTNMNYDIAGKVLNTTDPKGQQSSFNYNTLGQPTSAVFPAAGTAPAETVSYNYGVNGRTESVTDNRGTTTMSYENGSERVSSVSDPVTGAISYKYSPMGERLSMNLPGGGTWTYSYLDDQNYAMMSKDDPGSTMRPLASITDDQGRRVDYAFDGLGMPRTAKFNQTFDVNLNVVSYNETDYAYEYNSGDHTSRHVLNQLKNTWNYKDFNSVWHATTQVQNDYTYDTMSMRLTNQITSSDSTNRTEIYSYDEQNRLKTVNYGDGQTQGYSFDAMGNRTSKQDSVSGTEGYSYNAANMLLSKAGNSYTNDVDGNTLTGGGRTNTWDSQNRLTSCVNGANTSSFTYGADGLRRRTVVNGVTTDSVLDNSMFVRERRNSTNFATYLIGPRGPECRRDDTNGQVRWYLYDGLGSVLGEVDPSGNVTSSRKYDVYGLVRSGNNPGGTSSHKFVGQLGHPSEDNTGLIYMRARYYDPAVGRYTGEDNYCKSTNLFEYCDSNPTNKLDADGHLPGWAIWGLILLLFDAIESMGIITNPKFSEIMNFILFSKEAMELMKQLGESQEALRIINESVETINSADRRNTLTHVETMAVCGVSASFCVACAAYQLMLLFNMYDPQNGYQLLPY